MLELPQYLIDRFWSKVDKTSDPNGHWLWTASLCHNGYGQFTYQIQGHKKTIRVHKLAYLLLHPNMEEIPCNMQVLHKPPCTIRRCVVHTYLGTPQDNSNDIRCMTSPQLTDDVIREIRALRDVVSQRQLAQRYQVDRNVIMAIQLGKTCRNVSGFVPPKPIAKQGEGHGAAKLRDDDVRNIRARYVMHKTRAERYGILKALAHEYHVDKSTITLIVRRKTWTHI